MSEQTEERSEPASEKKLRDARQKGQLAKSQDMVTGMVMLVCTFCVVVLADDILSRARQFLITVSRIYVEPFPVVWPRVQTEAVSLLMEATLPILGATVVTVILVNMVTMRGMVFTTEPVKPDIQHINPAQGFKRLFSMRSITEFLKTLFKLLVVSVALVIVYRLGLQALMESSRCGGACVYASFLSLLTPLVMTAIIAFLIVGAVDLMIQRWLFAREMRMTRSEQKREHKDMEGNPEIKREQRRLRKDFQTPGVRVGLNAATLVVGQSGGWLVGLRYVRGQTPVPVVVFRAAPEDSSTLLARCAELGLVQVSDGELAEAIGKRTPPGAPVPDRFFQRVADVLVAARLI